MIKHQDEILLPAVSSDRTAVPRYDVVAPDGQTIHENVALKLANDVAQPGTPINKPLLDEFLAASGITAGSATAYTLAQEGYSLFDGAPVRFRLHTASGEGATLNINGTGAKPLRDVLGETMNEGIPAGTWLTATYSAAAGAYIIMSGGVKKSVDEAINGERYTVDDAVGYAKDVPENVLPYAEISEIGGMTYKDGNTLRSAAVTEVESVGMNLLDIPDIKKEVNGVSVEVNGGALYLSGTATGGGGRLSAIATITLSAGTYIAKGNGDIYLSNAKNNSVVSNFFETAFELSEETTLIAGLNTLEGREYSGTYYLTINKGETAQPYTPYFRDTLPIPEAVRALDGYGWGMNADCYNYVDWKNKRFVKRVDRVILDGVNNGVARVLDYGYVCNFVFSVDGAADSKSVLVCNYNSVVNAYDIVGNIYINSNGYLIVVHWDQAIKTMPEFNEYLKSNPIVLYYELATPIITDISSLLPADNIRRVQPGGTVTPINERGYAVPSTITYQRNVLNSRASTFEVEKVRAQQNGISVTLAAGAWSGNTQTIAVPGVTADNTVICSPDPASHDAYGKYGVYCISQADGQLTFRCKRTPDTALAVNIIAMGG